MLFLGRGRWFLRILGAMLATGAASAQGLSGASVDGRVLSPDGFPVAGATITLANASTGFTRRARSATDGGFLFENVAVGGPYTMTVNAVGFAPSIAKSLTLEIGDRLTQRFQLYGPAPQTLPPVDVRDLGMRNAGAGGPAYSISSKAIRTLPLLDRNFMSLFQLSAHATGASQFSVSGQHAKFNSIQIDGGSGNDVFGIGITPGAISGAKVISIEAIQEVRILVAPFDVRQGGFSGGLINAITKSGTNVLHGSSFTSLGADWLVGRPVAGAKSGKFNTLQYGASVGGPIIRDRLHFFVAVDMQSSKAPFEGQAVTDSGIGISEGTARRARQVFIDKYGFDPGGPEAPTLSQPTQNILLKLSAQLSDHHWADLTQSWANADKEDINRVVGSREQWQLSGSGLTRHSSNPTTRFRLTTAAGKLTNELMVSGGTARVSTESRSRAPVFQVQADVPNSIIAGGSSRGAQGTETSQRLIELTDNLSLSYGSHLVTLGSQNQFLRVHDNLFVGSWGAWNFGSVDSLERRLPSSYEVALPGPSGGPINNYHVSMPASYVQDKWMPTDRLTLTGGLRVDIPFSNSPIRNPALAADAALGNIDTSRFPSGNAVWSPRLGFSLDLGGRHQSMLRGGVGSFAGRSALLWIASAFVNTGQEQTLLKCGAREGIPEPTTDIQRLPSRCLTSQPTASAVPTINYVDPRFRFQHALKYALGFDHDFGNNLTSSLDFVSTSTRDHLLVDNVNLAETRITSEGRVMYGDITTSGSVRPSRLDAQYGPVFFFHNRSSERSTSIALAVTKHWESSASAEIG